jgi:hypothetical protein
MFTIKEAGVAKMKRKKAKRKAKRVKRTVLGY